MTGGAFDFLLPGECLEADDLGFRASCHNKAWF